MNGTTTLWKGLLFAVAVLSSVAFHARGAPDPRRVIRISPATLSLLATNRVRTPVTAAITNQTLRVKIPTNSTLLVRRGGSFVSAAPVRREGTNQVYELRPTDVYVARGAPPPPTPLSTNAVPLPDAVRAVVNGQEIEGHIEVALQSEQMVYNSGTREYEGTLDICFRSSAPPALARRLLPLDLRLRSTPGLQLATNALTLTNVGNAGCRGIDLQ